VPPTALIPRLRPFVSTIFEEINVLAVANDAVNLGQGAPDTDAPRGRGALSGLIR